MCSAPCVDQSGSPVDPFSVHIECDLTDDEVDSLKEMLSQPLHYQHTTVGDIIEVYWEQPDTLACSLPSILCWAQLVVLSVFLKETVVLPVRSSFGQNIM